MEAGGHTKETVGLLNVNSIHLNTLFDGITTRRFLWYDHDLPSKRLFKCIEFIFNNPTVSFL
jgi:hypothetical protein